MKKFETSGDNNSNGLLSNIPLEDKNTPANNTPGIIHRPSAFFFNTNTSKNPYTLQTINL